MVSQFWISFLFIYRKHYSLWEPPFGVLFGSPSNLLQGERRISVERHLKLIHLTLSPHLHVLCGPFPVRTANQSHLSWTPFRWCSYRYTAWAQQQNTPAECCPPSSSLSLSRFEKLQVLHQRTTLLIGDGSAIHAPSVRSRQLDVRKHFLVSTFPSKSVNKTTHGASATKCSMHCSQCLQAANQGS